MPETNTWDISHAHETMLDGDVSILLRHCIPAMMTYTRPRLQLKDDCNEHQMGGEQECINVSPAIYQLRSVNAMSYC